MPSRDLRPRFGSAAVSVALILAGLAAGAGLAVAAAPPAGAIDLALTHIYNLDFGGANRVLDECVAASPDSALVHSVRAAAILFEEFDRLHVLQTEFFLDDDKVTDRSLLKPDPAARARLTSALANARRLGERQLKLNPRDREAMFAVGMAAGIETEYVLLVEKRHWKAYSLSKESQRWARKMIALDPPVYDAYLTLGSIEYIVSSLNPLFRFFARFDGISGDRTVAESNLKRVIERGRYYPPFAKILLSVVYLREKRTSDAQALLTELGRDYPSNPLFATEVRHAAALSGAR